MTLELAESLPEPLGMLVREHRTIEEVIDEARHATGLAMHAAEPLDAARAAAITDTLRDLVAFLEVDLQVHIAKEEDVLFPAIAGLTEPTDLAVEDMLVQHDAVRERRAALEKLVAHLDEGHDDARTAISDVTGAIRGGDGRLSPAFLSEVHGAIGRLDAMLQGHFGDEEDGVFFPAVELLAAEQLAELDAAMRALEADFEA